MNLRDRIADLIEREIGTEKPVDLADHIIELVAKHLSGVQLGLFNEQG